MGRDRATKVEDYAGVGPLFQSGKPWKQQRNNAEKFPDAQDDKKIVGVAEAVDNDANLGHSEDIPYASNGRFGDE